MVIKRLRRPNLRPFLDKGGGTTDMIDMTVGVNQRADWPRRAGQERLFGCRGSADAHPRIHDHISIVGPNQDDIGEVVSNSDEDPLAGFNNSRLSNDLFAMGGEGLFGRDGPMHLGITLDDAELRMKIQPEQNEQAAGHGGGQERNRAGTCVVHGVYGYQASVSRTGAGPMMTP